MRNRSSFILALLLCYCVAACQQKKTDQKMDKENYFGWQPDISAPKEYPIKTAHVRFTAADSSGGGMMSMTAQQGWGEGGAGSLGTHNQPIPIRLDICWLSYAENQFWKGNFVLPYDTMLANFRKGWTETNGIDGKAYHDTYGTIMVGMAPGGVVVVWLQGGKNYQVEVARFQAQKGTDDMKDINELVANSGGNMDIEWLKQPGAKDHYVKTCLGLADTASIKDYLAKKSIPYGLWDRYREKFNWRPVLEASPRLGQDTGYVLHESMNEFYNGEQDILDSTDLKTNPYRHQARVKKLAIHWTSGSGAVYDTDINMDEEEAFAAYKEIYGKENVEQQAELVMEVSRYNDEIHVFLRSRYKEVDLKKVAVKTWDSK